MYVYICLICFRINRKVFSISKYLAKYYKCRFRIKHSQEDYYASIAKWSLCPWSQIFFPSNSFDKVGCLFQMLSLFFFKFIFERETARGGGAKREEDTESEVGSRLWAVSTKPNMRLELMNCEIMTWAKAGRSTSWAIGTKNVFTFVTIIFL